MSVLPEFEDPDGAAALHGRRSFMRAPYREDPQGVDIGLIGVPFDGGVTNRTGTRHGPREIRNQSSLMRKINQAEPIAPYELCTVADLGDAWVQRPFHLESSPTILAVPQRRIHAAGDPALRRRRPFDLAADPRAIAAERSVGMRIDAHCDTGSNGIRAPTTITARRSRAPSRRGCSIRRARSRSASAAASTTATSSNTYSTKQQKKKKAYC